MYVLWDSMLSLDLRTGLAHPLECQRDLPLVAARYAVREYVNVIAMQEKAQGGPHDMQLRSVEWGYKLFALTRNTAHLDALKD